MAKHPFRHPTRISETHEKLRQKLRDFLEVKPEKLEEKIDYLYRRFREAEAERYKSASDYHCCYCGEKRDRLDLDHFLPKGATESHNNTAKYCHPKRNDLLEYYKYIAGDPSVKLSVSRQEKYFIDCCARESYAKFCIEPTNIIPACPDCNTGGKGRDFADAPFKFGKGDLFPVMECESKEPLLLHPGKVNWKDLLDHFDFIDLNDPERNARKPAWGGTARSTIVVPRFDKSLLELKFVKAATAIEIFGLNRKALSEQRFRMRQLFRGILHAANSTKVAKGDPQSPTVFIKQNIPLHTAAFTIRAFICENPHKLALLDVLREWLGSEFSRIENLDRFLSPTL
ncbi:MAG: hypothetical protein P9F75_00415 [Candidatus Contendobacter sp.]|nr:hypothetical protein [Candidatus Contendobacter sp.]